ncbi:MAG: c-type cytochrome [Gammaproteobacteria bacterium]|nr:c-type cytochrome [Gammaproteobacteria bacterium]MBL4728770.1 c-type cytochrome [Gammaproteobacteria bacterium]
MIKRSIGILSLSLLAMVSRADEKIDEAYQAFLQSQGEASWINAAANHPLANTANRPIPPIESFSSDPAKQALGFELFHDARLSRSGTVSCSSCHTGMMGGADGSRVSVGVGGLLGTRNSPTVFNSAFNFRQFWDGRAFDLDSQALGPITNPVEMGHDLEVVLQNLATIPHYAEQFASIYPDGLTAANLGNAIAQHSRDMTRSDSRFNEHLSTGAVTLSEQELRGWERFNDVGCASCHNGINLGGNSYQKMGNVGPLSNTAMIASLDEGLFARTGREQDRQVFKVPSLNNVALTAPYFHDGSVSSLEEAVRQMGQVSGGRKLSNADVEDIVSFLGSLSSEAFAGMSSRMGNMGGMRQQMRQRMQQMHHGEQQGQQMNHGQHHDASTDQTRQMRRH